MVRVLRRVKLSVFALSVGVLFFSASLTPSMIPRSAALQGVLGGVTFALGYLLAVAIAALWCYLELPKPRDRFRTAAEGAIAIVGIGMLIAALMRNNGYQNELRALMGMPSLEQDSSATIIAAAFGTFGALLLLGRLVKVMAAKIQRRLARRIPPRAAMVASLTMVAVISWNIGNGVILRSALDAADSGLREVDAFIDPELPPPDGRFRAGGAGSLVSWPSLGARGREFVAGGWTEEEISRFHGGAPATTPVRIYAGLNSADNVSSRAHKVLEEMLRVGAFGRRILVIVSPTGTGWVDPEAVDPLEVMHRGDTAIVAMQYSYLSSPLSLLFEPDLAPESAQALAGAIYNYWVTLPPETRPRLYLHGLSLGSYASEQALSPLRLISDPIDGALWSGPTFNNAIWKSMTRNRNPGSPYWSPRIDDSSVVRFTTQKNTLDSSPAQWARTRAIYLQYPSDPITFFEVQTAYRRPEWMMSPRAPDVSEEFTWFPIVTMLQLAMDMATATDVSKGFGHLFSAAHYIDAWESLTDPEAWSESDANRLRSVFQ